MQPENSNESGLLRKVALVATVVAAVLSLLLMFWVGRKNESVILMALFAGWVFSPFAGQLVAYRVSQGWAPHSRKELYVLMMATAFFSLFAYTDIAFGSSATKAAFPFLATPFTSWLVTSVVVIRGLRHK